MTIRHRLHVLPLLAVLIALPPACAERKKAESAPFPPGYLDEIDDFRRGRVENLTGEEGWLSLVGLYWLNEGESRFGAAPDNDVVLPLCCGLAEAPPRLGSLLVEEGRVTLRSEEGSGLTVDGESVGERMLVDDSGESPTVLARGSLRMTVIARSGRLALRVRDVDSPARRSLADIESFPLDPAWRLEGRFVPYEPPRSMDLPSVMGWDVSQSSPGAILFETAGRSVRLDVFAESRDEPLFVIFGDTTNGEETYKGGRYLYVETPAADDSVIVDFNRSYSPPCVFTPYATCPLPPSQNRLPFRVEAGEKLPAVVAASPIH